MLFNWFNRLGVQRKMIISNLLIIVIPFIVLFIALSLVWGVIRYTNPVEHRQWMMLAPSSIQAQVFQLGLEQINKKLSKEATTVRDVLDSSAILEAQGLDIVILKDNEIVYATPNIEPNIFLSNVRHVMKGLESNHYLNWEGNQFTYVNSYNTGLSVYGSGRIPFMTKSMGPESTDKKLVEGAFGVGILLLLAIIIGIGIYISNRLGEYILRPVTDLKQAADDLKNGIVPKNITVRNHDELGATCEAFNNMQDALMKAHEEQSRYEVRRREMIAGICHDISTPLTSVKGYVSGILEGVANTEEKQARYVQRIFDMAGRIEHLVTMLSDFSQLELKQIHYDRDTYALDDLIHGYIRERNLNDHEHIVLHEDYDAKDSLIVIDRIQFYRVLDNLVSNSIKYRYDDFIHIDITTAKIENACKLVFSDNGKGVPTEMLNRLFDIFFRTDEARTEVANGNGIGLAIVKQIVVDMNGIIYAEHNKNGRGLSIVMEFPCVKE